MFSALAIDFGTYLRQLLQQHSCNIEEHLKMFGMLQMMM